MRRHFYPAMALLALVIFIFPTGVMAGEHGEKTRHWTYEGEESPEHWGEISPDYAVCKTGKLQSPVDITKAVKKDLPALAMSYKPSVVRILNNGHAVQVNHDAGSTLTAGGKSYELAQYHFHSPSEYKINGKQYPMEAHFVHKSKDGKLAVIGVMFKEGKKNGLIDKLWAALPKEVGKEAKADTLSVIATDLMPKDMGYYHFIGSLTTPPCTEGVEWYVMKSPLEISADQSKALVKTLGTHNARPVQPLGDRVIEESR